MTRTHASATCESGAFAGAEPPARPSHIRELDPSRARFVVSDADRIRGILECLCAVRATGLVRCNGLVSGANGHGAVGAAKLAPGPRLFVSADFLADALKSAWIVEIEGPFSLVRFELEPEGRQHQGLFALPTALHRIYRRSDRRIIAPPGAWIRFANPESSDILAERPVHDIGYRGLRFLARPEDRFIVGQTLSDFAVSWKHGPRIELTAEVRHVSSSIVAGECLCGILVTAKSQADEEAWGQEVSDLLHPHTSIGMTGVHQEIWDLYDRSGYFQLGGGSTAGVEDLRDAFGCASQKLASAQQLGCQVVRSCRGRVEASLTLLRAWSGAWLAYQLARRQDQNPLALSGNSVLRDIFLHAYETAQREVAFRWQISYVRKDARFSHRVWREFAALTKDLGSTAVVPFRAMEVPCHAALPLALPENTEVCAADPEEIVAALATLARGSPYPYLDAYDLVPDRFDLRELRRSWAAADLRRDRQVLVARRHGLPWAVAILDACENGIHLVGLLDGVHLVSLVPNGTECYPMLLGAAQEYYGRRGKRKFILFEETGDPSYALRLGIRDLGAADQIFVSSALTHEFLDHICLITAPRRVRAG